MMCVTEWVEFNYAPPAETHNILEVVLKANHSTDADKLNNTWKTHNKPNQLNVKNTTSYADLVASYNTRPENDMG